jgi:hypothetical protein
MPPVREIVNPNEQAQSSSPDGAPSAIGVNAPQSPAYSWLG